MRAGAVVAGVLGAGCALVFALAIAASVLFPNGGSISATFNQGFGGPVPIRAFAQPIAVPVPMPAESPDQAPNAGGRSEVASPSN